MLELFSLEELGLKKGSIMEICKIRKQIQCNNDMLGGESKAGMFCTEELCRGCLLSFLL